MVTETEGEIEIEAEVHVAGAHGPFQRDELLDLLEEAAADHGLTLQAFDPEAVYNEAHLRAAAEKALRAHAQGRELARELGVEIACYAAGTHQISDALATVGVPVQGEAVVLVGVGRGAPAAIKALLQAAGLEEDAGLLGPNPAALDRLGIGQRMREMVPEADWGLLVQEKVALLDVEK